jgi:hypothetical protein
MCVLSLYTDKQVWYDETVTYWYIRWLNLVDNRWQQYSTHLHKNNKQNNTINNFGSKAFWDSNPDWSN